MRNWLFTTEPKRPQYYNGMLIHADTDLHEQAIDLVQKYVSSGALVLDLGAGAGAFSTRLVHRGYSVVASDIDPEKWIPVDIPFIRLNIDAGIYASLQQEFDAACCLEVIEHVENPWNLLREMRKVIRPGGHLILSTPNITSFFSRLVFLRTGLFHQFSEADLSYGHINPLSAFELQIIANQTGWRILEIRPGGYLPVFDLTSLAPRNLLLNLLRGVIFLLSAKGQRHGWCLFFALENPQ
jgi:2-polyprenyl-3-methyl-5-hydroxy-6-metoxy-1,4-benzoquinol methylase